MLVHLDLDESRRSFEAMPVRINDEATPVPVESSDNDSVRIVSLLKALSGETGVELEYEDDVLTVADVGEVDTRQWVRDRTRSYPWLNILQLTEYSSYPLTLEDVLLKNGNNPR